MPINETKLAALLATLLSDSGEAESGKAQESVKSEEVKSEAGKPEEGKLEEAGQKSEQEDPSAKRLRELEEQHVSNQNKLVETKLEAGYASIGLDTDTTKGLNEFLSYDKLKNDNGEADEERIKEFLDTLSGAALRKPPKHKDVLDELQSNADGFGKYLSKK